MRPLSTALYEATHTFTDALKPLALVEQTETDTHPHAGLQADLRHDGQQGDTSLHSANLGTDKLVGVRRLWEVGGAALVRCEGYRCDVRTLRGRWSRWVRGAAGLEAEGACTATYIHSVSRRSSNTSILRDVSTVSVKLIVRLNQNLFKTVSTQTCSDGVCVYRSTFNDVV